MPTRPNHRDSHPRRLLLNRLICRVRSTSFAVALLTPFALITVAENVDAGGELQLEAPLNSTLKVRSATTNWTPRDTEPKLQLDSPGNLPAPDILPAPDRTSASESSSEPDATSPQRTSRTNTIQAIPASGPLDRFRKAFAPKSATPTKRRIPTAPAARLGVPLPSQSAGTASKTQTTNQSPTANTVANGRSPQETDSAPSLPAQTPFLPVGDEGDWVARQAINRVQPLIDPSAAQAAESPASPSAVESTPPADVSSSSKAIETPAKVQPDARVQPETNARADFGAQADANARANEDSDFGVEIEPDGWSERARSSEFGVTELRSAELGSANRVAEEAKNAPKQSRSEPPQPSNTLQLQAPVDPKSNGAATGPKQSATTGGDRGRTDRFDRNTVPSADIPPAGTTSEGGWAEEVLQSLMDTSEKKEVDPKTVEKPKAEPESKAAAARVDDEPSRETAKPDPFEPKNQAELSSVKRKAGSGSSDPSSVPSKIVEKKPEKRPTETSSSQTAADVASGSVGDVAVDNELPRLDYTGYPAKKVAPTRSVASMRRGIERTLQYFYDRPEVATGRSNWGMMHSLMVYGAETRVQVGRQYLNAIAWIAGNNNCRGQRLLTHDPSGIIAKSGAGLQGHQGQFLAVLGMCHVPLDYPLHAGKVKYTVRDLLEAEKRNCRKGAELTFTLIGLSHYIDTESRWIAADGTEWDFQRMLAEELKQPIVGAACGGTHRLMGFAHALRKRRAEGRPIEGHWRRAEVYSNDFVKYAYSLQNRDGSMSTDWFEGRAAKRDIDRKIQTTGHMVEWLLTLTPNDQLQNPRLVRSVNFLVRTLSSELDRDWSIGPKGHALRSLAMYHQRVFEAGSPWVERSRTRTAQADRQTNRYR